MERKTSGAFVPLRRAWACQLCEPRCPQWRPDLCVCGWQVRDDTYRMVHRLQVQVQDFKLFVTKDSLHQQRRQLEGLRRRLRDAEASLQKLGFLAMLVNFLIGQNLVSAVQEEVTAFVTRTMKVLCAPCPRVAAAPRSCKGPAPRPGAQPCPGSGLGAPAHSAAFWPPSRRRMASGGRPSSGCS